MPVLPAVMLFCIFMASMTQISWPSATCGTEGQTDGARERLWAGTRAAPRLRWAESEHRPEAPACTQLAGLGPGPQA